MLPLRPGLTLERWQRGGTPHSSKLQHYWNLTIRLFSVILGHSFRESYLSAEIQSTYSTVPVTWAKIFQPTFTINHKGKKLDSCLSQGYACKEKRKEYSLGFELASPVLFSVMITTTLRAPFQICCICTYIQICVHANSKIKTYG